MLRVAVKPFTLICPAASQALSPCSPSPVLTPQGQQLAGRPVFLSQTRYACLPLAVPLAAVFTASANHGAAQVATEARQGGAQTGWNRSSREACVFVKGEIERVKDKQK